MFAAVLITAFAFASLATVLVLADSGLRWWSAFGLLRRRMKQGYETSPVGPRPSALLEGSLGFARSQRAYPVIRQSSQRAA